MKLQCTMIYCIVRRLCSCDVHNASTLYFDQNHLSPKHSTCLSCYLPLMEVKKANVCALMQRYRVWNHRRAFCIYTSRMCTWGRRLFISMSFHFENKGMLGVTHTSSPHPADQVLVPCLLLAPTGVPSPLFPPLTSLLVRGRAMLGRSLHATF